MRPLEWSGEAEQEKAHHAQNGQLLVQINPKFYRPAEVELLIGDYSKAEKVLGWKPQTRLSDLCGMMVKSDLQKLAAGQDF